jgi:hypothetical protein
MNQVETKLQWATREFEQVASGLTQEGFRQSGTGLSFIQPPPGDHEVKAQLFPNLPDPWIRVTKASKPGLILGFSGEKSRPIQFDVVDIDDAYYWIEQEAATGALSSKDVVHRVVQFGVSPF